MPTQAEIQSIVAGHRTVSDRIRALVSAGVPKPDVARVLGVSANHVYSTLARDRAKGAAVAGPVPASGMEQEIAAMVVVDEAGRMTLPSEVVELMELKGGDKLVLLAGPGEARIMKKGVAAQKLQIVMQAAAPGEAALARALLSDIDG